MKGTVIRNAKETDFWECVELARRAWPDFKERPSIYHLFCKFFNRTCFVAGRGGKIHGFLLGFLSQVDSKEAYIHLVAVDPKHQRRGIASLLYDKFFKTVTRMGGRRVSLIVNPDNGPSLRFHKNLGFHKSTKVKRITVRVMAIKDYNGPGIHMVLFHKDLEP